MNKRRIITGVITIVVATVAVIGATTAYFSDSETSTGNIFQAGKIDLRIDNVQHYNGMVCAERTGMENTGYMWVPNQEPVFLSYDAENHPSTSLNPTSQEIIDHNIANLAQYPKAGVDCDGEDFTTGSWRLTDLGSHRFFNFLDIKPGDFGENTISLHVDNNDAWVCAALGNVKGVEGEEGQVAANTAFLSDMNFFAWHDDGNNIYNPNPTNVDGDGDIAIGSINGANLGNGVLAIADATTGAPIPGATTKYVAVAWCAGTLGPDAGTCDGTTMGNAAQGGGFTADIEFYAVQSRNNAGFNCNNPQHYAPFSN